MEHQPGDIRPAELRDIPGIERVARATWAATYAGIIPDEIQRRLLGTWYSAAALARAIGARESSFLVAERAGTVIGFAHYVRRSPDAAELTRIYVLPEHQRSGTGTRLLEAGLADCRGRGARQLTVFVERANTAGRRFYRTHGFVEVGEVSQDAEGHCLQLVRCQRPV